jgi:hypothetical protein
MAMAKNKDGNNQNKKPATTGINGAIALSPESIGKDGKDFGTVIGHAALTGITLTIAAGVMYGIKAGFCKLFGLPFGETEGSNNNSQQNDRPDFNEVLACAYKSIDSTESDDPKTVVDSVIEYNPEYGHFRSMVEGAVKKALSNPQ